MRVIGRVVNLVFFLVNVMFDFSNNLKYGICWNFDHVWVQQEEGYNNRQSSPTHVHLMWANLLHLFLWA